MNNKVLKTETCCWESCKENGYFEKEVESYICPFHWYIGMVEELDSHIRDCWPINWKLSKQQQLVIDYIRNEVRNFLIENSNNYELHKHIDWKEKQILKRKEK